MSLKTALASIKYWSDNYTWSLATGSVLTTPTAGEISDVTSIISGLYKFVIPGGYTSKYSGMGTIGAALDQYISDFGGVLNIGHAKDNNVDYAVSTMGYMAFDESRSYIVWDTTGQLRDESFTRIVGHELGHLLFNTADALIDSDEVKANQQMNQSTWDYVGSSVTFENTMAKKLDSSTFSRASYDGIMLTADTRYLSLGGQTDFTGGGSVKIVRLGYDDLADNIDMSTRTDGYNALLFGFGGNDVITGTSKTDYIYGGTGDDTINGGNGVDYLYGQDDADQIHGGNSADFLVGGSGSDMLYGDAGDDYLVAAHGDAISLDKTMDGFPNGKAEDEDRLYGGDNNDTFVANSIGRQVLVGGNGDDVFNVSEGKAFIYGQLGDDQINILSGSQTVAAIFVEDSSFANLKDGEHDSIYWHGTVASGVLTVDNDDQKNGKTYSDSNGFNYVWNEDAGTLKVSFPDKVQLTLLDYTPGDWGISIGSVAVAT